MQKLYSTFPGGKFGIGLLILRMATGIATGYFGGILLSSLESFTKSQFSYVSHLILGLLLVTGCIFLILGFMMPFVSITVAVCELIAACIRLMLTDSLGKVGFGWTSLLLLASIAIALTFLGPGALSIDARLYGRRQIFIPSSKKEERRES